MQRYDIKCDSLDKPEQWVYLKDLNHALDYAKDLFLRDDLLGIFIEQNKDFIKLYHQLLFEPYHERGKLDLIALQIRLQEDCINEFNWICFRIDPHEFLDEWD